MPTCTEHQQAANALHEAFLVNLMVEAEASVIEDDLAYHPDSDNNFDSLDSESSSSFSLASSSSDEEPEPMTSDTILDAMGQLYSQHYLEAHGTIDKDSNQLFLLLNNWKINQPEIFQSYLCVTPNCFDGLIETIQDDPIFHNQSNNLQMPIDEQVVIALYRFGHYGNGVSTMKVTLGVGVGYRTIKLVTNHVMKALHSEQF